MPDISMCPGGECPVKQECYRFMAVPSEPVQCFFVAPPIGAGRGCVFFTPIEGRKCSNSP